MEFEPEIGSLNLNNDQDAQAKDGAMAMCAHTTARAWEELMTRVGEGQLQSDSCLSRSGGIKECLSFL